jgi:hypothetical protein
MAVANTLAHCDTATITTLKSYSTGRARLNHVPQFQEGLSKPKLNKPYFYSLGREPLLKGRLSTVDLLVLTSLDQLLLIVQTHYLHFYKTSYPNEEVNCTEPSPSVSVPWSWSKIPERTRKLTGEKLAL